MITSCQDDSGNLEEALKTFGVLMDLRFILSEPDSHRSSDAATRLLSAFEQLMDIQKGEKREIDLRFPDWGAAQVEGPELGILNLAVVVGGAAPPRADPGRPLGPSERAVFALKTFIAVTEQTACSRSFVGAGGSKASEARSAGLPGIPAARQGLLNQTSVYLEYYIIYIMRIPP